MELNRFDKIIMSKPNIDDKSKAIRRSVISDTKPINGGPIIKPKKLIEETAVIAMLAEIVFNLPAVL